MTPGKLRALLKDLWQDSPVNFVLDDGTPLKVKTHAVRQRTVKDDDGKDKLGGPPTLTVWLEPVGMSDVPPPAQTVDMKLRGDKDIDEVTTS